MARTSNLIIKESVEELRRKLNAQGKHRNINRIRVLLHIKNNVFPRREDLGEFIGVTRRTIERWLSDYKKGGLDHMLSPEKLERKSHLIPPEVHQALEDRVMNSKEGFSSYVEAQKWILEEYNLDLKYNTVREHLIRHFKTKIKSPRKSHVKKDKQAIEVFLKTT